MQQYLGKDLYDSKILQKLDEVNSSFVEKMNEKNLDPNNQFFKYARFSNRVCKQHHRANSYSSQQPQESGYKVIQFSLKSQYFEL